MSKKLLALSVTALTLSMPMFAFSQQGQMKGMDMPMKHSASALKPAEGASVKIVSPKEGQAFKSDEVPLRFKLTKGKRGEHVHAYVDGELMGMFKSEKGTLTGIKQGQHILELRVVAEDDVTELDATDKVRFVVK